MTYKSTTDSNINIAKLGSSLRGSTSVLPPLPPNPIYSMWELSPSNTNVRETSEGFLMNTPYINDANTRVDIVPIGGWEVGSSYTKLFITINGSVSSQDIHIEIQASGGVDLLTPTLISITDTATVYEFDLTETTGDISALIWDVDPDSLGFANVPQSAVLVSSIELS